MKIIDITHFIKDGMVVYPNNAEISISAYAKISDGASSNLSKVILGTHTATHVDAPLHVFDGREKLEDLPLENFIGPCRVIDTSHRKAGELVEVEDLGEVSEGERILVKTSNSDRGIDEFYDDFVALSGDAADFLADKNITLFGIDYLSIKQRGSDDNRAHTSLLEKNIPIVEGLNLKDVSAGNYELICLPLKLKDVEGGPVRAVLISR
ncbi:cyclase family protein [Candidatus Nomurabacteria bacterium]|nr:cyclase family protein [Candidatus Nomurabacteria bacterium]